jgi:hypothetical protein
MWCSWRLELAGLSIYTNHVRSFEDWSQGILLRDALLLSKVSLLTMITLFVLCFSSIVSGAAIEQRDPVPVGYVAPPYYPSTSSKPPPARLSYWALQY